MKAVLISTDLIKKTDGEIKVLETNTNSWLSMDWNLYDFTTFTAFIQTNNYSEVHVITPNYIKPISLKIKEICDSINVTHIEHLLSNDAVTIPYIEDSESKLILRFSYDTTAIIDDEYCRDKFKLQSLVHDQTFGAKTFIPVELDGVTIDDFSELEEFNYTDNIPNFIIKHRYPNYDKEIYPKLFKVQNLTELNVLKNTLEENTYLQEFVQSDLVEGRRNIIRSLDFLYGGNLDIINIGSYIVTNQIEETIWENTFDENGLLAKKDRPKYITHTANPINSEHEYVYDIDNEVAMSDGTRKSFSSLIINDSVKALHIEGLDLNETTYYLETWTADYDTFIQNVSIQNTSVTATRQSSPVSQLFIKITLNDGTSWNDVKRSPLLVKDNNSIRFKRVNDMVIGDTIVTYNFVDEQVELKTISNLEIVFEENQILGSLDVEPIDLYLPFVATDFTIVQHNLCKPFCNNNGCHDSGNCGDCSWYYCNK